MDFNSAESGFGLLKRQVLKPLAAGKVPPAANEDSRAASNPHLSSKLSVSVVAENAFFRSCLARCLDREDSEFEIAAYEHIDAWRQAANPDPKSIVILCANGQPATEAIIQQARQVVQHAVSSAQVIVISDVEKPALMLGALEQGIKGYVPMSLDLEVVIGAINLVKVGGTFIPASTFLMMRDGGGVYGATIVRRRTEDLLTERQLNVLEILRKGDPNKIIAHKLKMSEATVKIHVRNIMKRVNARNRTELVRMTSDLF
ncbi:DNA-binding response regulator [Labrys miyagiensis]|uniref:DNA-binding response regulator n=1 Tax=Labrys miyagiensis TaxID=346912 RepID=A0ABQ6CRZ3_9HYPH|nr:response regulator transcription factor [Labrys miyagiensis]GLS23118.1 DNA-binding response regulator [Labrys miyagiensis]